MNETRNIALVGFSGTGKTTVGRLLAARLGRRFVDTDVVVEQRAGMPIPRIFAVLGEPAFREMEAAAIRDASRMLNVVISVGGGAMERESNREALRRYCIVAVLKASPQCIVDRLKGDQERPMLAGHEGEARMRRVADLLRQRALGYLEAGDLIVDTERAPHSVAEDIMSRLGLVAAARTRVLTVPQ